jgi:hypothetical protein
MKLVYGIQTLALFAGAAVAEDTYDDYSDHYGDEGDFNEAAYEADYAAKSKGPLRHSSMQFNGWVGPFEYDGISLMAIGADVDNFHQVLPGETLGCTVYQPSMSWGHADFVNICETINDLGGILTECTDIDDDYDGGLCPNAADKSFILTYENWGTGQSTGPDVWASQTTWRQDAAGFDSYYYGGGAGIFPSKWSNAGCNAVSDTWSVVVYACSDFNNPAQTTTSYTGPQDLLGACSAGTDTSSLYGCWCQALGTDASPLMGRPRDDMDEACHDYNHCMSCNSCSDKSLRAEIGAGGCSDIDCHHDACCQCAADFAAAAEGLTMDPLNENLDSTSCVRTIVSKQC